LVTLEHSSTVVRSSVFYSELDSLCAPANRFAWIPWLEIFQWTSRLLKNGTILA